MFLAGRWYRLTIRPDLDPGRSDRPAADHLLTRNVIEPLFGLVDPRTDKRIDFVGGARGLDGLERRVNRARWRSPSRSIRRRWPT